MKLIFSLFNFFFFFITMQHEQIIPKLIISELLSFFKKTILQIFYIIPPTYKRLNFPITQTNTNNPMQLNLFIWWIYLPAYIEHFTVSLSLLQVLISLAQNWCLSSSINIELPITAIIIRMFPIYQYLCVCVYQFIYICNKLN